MAFHHGTVQVQLFLNPPSSESRKNDRQLRPPGRNSPDQLSRPTLGRRRRRRARLLPPMQSHQVRLNLSAFILASLAAQNGRNGVDLVFLRQITSVRLTMLSWPQRLQRISSKSRPHRMLAAIAGEGAASPPMNWRVFHSWQARS